MSKEYSLLKNIEVRDINGLPYQNYRPITPEEINYNGVTDRKFIQTSLTTVGRKPLKPKDILIGDDGFIYLICRCKIHKYVRYKSRFPWIARDSIYGLIEDLPNGKMLVQCQMCGCVFETTDTLSNIREICPRCNIVLHYPDGASW